MSTTKKLVLVGNGMAGIRTIEHILKLAPHAYEITVFGAEPHPNYNRIMLSSVLAGGTSIEDIVINEWSWYEDNGIRVYPGDPVVQIDPKRKEVVSQNGVRATYDELIMATGSQAFILPLPGANKEGVIGFRDIKDCETMMAASQKYRKAAVIGGGLLGLEAARGLLNLGMDVTVIHINGHLMDRNLDLPAGLMLQRELEEQGMKFLLNKHTEEITGKHRVKAIRFTDQTVLEADLVVMAVGIRPQIELARNAGLDVNRGVIVDDYMHTSIPGISAVGECAEHRGIAYGLVAPLYEQGMVLAKRLAGAATEGYAGSVTSTKLKVSGVDVFSAGQFKDAADTRSIRIQDDVDGVYKKMVIKDGQLIGAVLFGDTTDGASLFSLIKSGENISGREKEILLGVPSGGSDSGPSVAERMASMPDDEIVCGCNGVTKASIGDAVLNKGCNTLGAIKSCTKASASCGGCKPIIENLLTYYAGDNVGEQTKEGICGCTSYDRDEIVAQIKEMGLKSVKEVMNVLGWDEPEGCSKCRPSLNYYLGMIWPAEYTDERVSKFTNERYHANIQKDGTYSVIPRIYGGVTSPAELIKIATVAEKYDVPLVKFTGGQRLDLLGVQKENLPKIWEELDMPSGFGYGKALRTVKTCVGNTFCRFGTQDSIEMGIRLEKKLDKMVAPAKVKLAVSGCPRNCAEATIKDLGVVAIDGAWEIHVGGNAGVKVRAAELLCTVKTDAEVEEWTYSYLQYYRENAKWNERTAAWIERVGLDHVKEALADRDVRLALVERLEVTLGHTVDPWKEIIQDEKLRKNFTPLSGAEPVTH
ncbi:MULTISPECIES: nitrite reductase large subunit NirB [Paenibacillus]|uniref:nitrite reductase large subunit NirB n=1 Tax=Paenibacillus TaxID=44249 RepID=UPI000F525D6A|nr:nitrite reductase large subunit NirB [Paenibacillus xylanexedens]RPK26209.1 Nitrite reductase [Paenibacillus xylanexedens]